MTNTHYQPSTTVLITVYNGSRFLLQQLDSLREQSLPANEVLISDDASTDDSHHLVHEYIHRHRLEENWVLSRNTINKGYIENFLSIAEQASSELLLFCDQDDIWQKNKIELLVNSYQSQPDALAITSGYKVIDSKGGEAGTLFTKLRANHSELRKVSLPEQLRRNFSVGFALSARRDFYRLLIPIIRRNKLTFDVPIGLFAAAFDGYYSLGHPLVLRRVHENNISAPMYSLMSRLQNPQRHIEGRYQRVRLWEAAAKELGKMGETDAEEYINEGTDQLKITLSSLVSHDASASAKLFLTAHASISRVLILVDTLVILFANRSPVKREL
jgi:glycosyltransferase involved in cell wall biosynthesis